MRSVSNSPPRPSILELPTAKRPDARRNRPASEVLGTVATECDKDRMFAAGALDGAAADDTSAAGEESGLEQHRRRKRFRPGPVVAITSVKTSWVKLVVSQVIGRMLETAGAVAAQNRLQGSAG